MLDGILTPAFMQAASAHKQAEPTVITLKALQADPVIVSVTCPNEFTVVSTKDGVEHTKTESALTESNLTIEADGQTQFTIIGVDFVINNLGNECEIVTDEQSEEEQTEEQPEEPAEEESVEEEAKEQSEEKTEEESVEETETGGKSEESEEKHVEEESNEPTEE